MSYCISSSVIHPLLREVAILGLQLVWISGLLFLLYYHVFTSLPIVSVSFEFYSYWSVQHLYVSSTHSEWDRPWFDWPVLMWTCYLLNTMPSIQKVPGLCSTYWTHDLWLAFDLCKWYASDTQGIMPCEGWGVTATQLDLPSLMPLSVAGYGLLQLGAAHWATSVSLLQVVDDWPYKLW